MTALTRVSVQKMAALGPGLVMAGAAIGVSHLVQSTRAGADFGFSLISLVVLINLIKYPFFEYGHRYAAATGENLVQGYNRLGKIYLYIFVITALCTSVISIAGVTYVTATIASFIFNKQFLVLEASFLCLLITSALALIGKFKWLDFSIKIIVAILFLATMMALIKAVSHGPVYSSIAYGHKAPEIFSFASLPFLVALFGWMPAPLEMSVWQSLWVQAKANDLGKSISVTEAKIDFNIGYGLTIITAVMFICLGALIMHGSPEMLSDSGAGFVRQLLNMYETAIGKWSMPLVAISALATMFSTTITVVDAYPRSLVAATGELFHGQRKNSKILIAIYTVLAASLSLLLISRFMDHFTQLVDFVTTISFITAPILAYLNHKLIFSSATPTAEQPSGWRKNASRLGIAVLGIFAAGYIFSLFL